MSGRGTNFALLAIQQIQDNERILKIRIFVKRRIATLILYDRYSHSFSGIVPDYCMCPEQDRIYRSRDISKTIKFLKIIGRSTY